MKIIVVIIIFCCLMPSIACADDETEPLAKNGVTYCDSYKNISGDLKKVDCIHTTMTDIYPIETTTHLLCDYPGYYLYVKYNTWSDDYTVDCRTNQINQK